MSREYRLVCRICGKEYIGKSAKFKVCDKCREPITVRCYVCGKEILLNDYQMRKLLNGEIHKDSFVCSIKCKNKGIKDKGYRKICKHCGKEFIAKSMTCNYCNECLKPIKTKCIVCGKEFYTNYRQTLKIINGNNVVCSNKCSVKLSTESYKDKTGFHNPSNNPEVVQSRKDSYYSKTGYSSPFSDPEVKDKIIETNLNKYGVPYACMTENCRKSSRTISNINKYYYEYFECDGYEFHIGKYSYDLYKGNILIEINPTYTHNSTIGNRWNNNPIPSNYHVDKTNVAIENGYRCIHIFDWDNKAKIYNLLSTDKEYLYARKCSIHKVSVSDCNKFLEKYHIQGTCRGQTTRLGLYYNDELVCLITFGKPRYNKNYEYELLRLCTNSKYIVVGGASKLFKYFIRNYNPISIISYCDKAKFTGNVYGNIGMIYKYTTKPSVHWYNCNTGKHITDNNLRKNGYDRLFNTNYGKGTDNRKLMIDNGFLEIYDCGQLVYEWKRDDYTI